MLQRTTTLPSGIRITQESDTELHWEYRSDALGKLLAGRLTHTTEEGGGWLVYGDTPGLIFLTSMLVGAPQRLRDAITEVENIVKRTEAESAKIGPIVNQRDQEVEALFSERYDFLT